MLSGCLRGIAWVRAACLDPCHLHIEEKDHLSPKISSIPRLYLGLIYIQFTPMICYDTARDCFELEGVTATRISSLDRRPGILSRGTVSNAGTLAASVSTTLGSHLRNIVQHAVEILHHMKSQAYCRVLNPKP